VTKANILLVDDQPANLLALEAILDGLDLNLVRARSGEEALRHMEGKEFAAVLLDIHMPGMDGFETATHIRSREGGGRTPILFVTAHEGDRAWVERAYALGAVDYLVKPLVPVIVRAKVAGFVELFEKTQEVIRQAEELRRWDRRGFEERLAEEGDRLRRSEGRFRTLADSIPQLAWMTRPDGHIEWYNRRWFEYTGTTPEAMEGWGWQAVHDPAELPRVMANWTAAIADGEPWEDTFPLRRHDGQMRWHLSRALPLKDDGGRVVGWFGTNTDIEDRRRDVEALRAAKDQAEAALRAKDDFLAVLSHELRTPLTPVLAAASALEGRPDLMPEVRDDIGVIRRNVEHEARLIDDLLTLTDLMRGEARLHMEAVDAHAALLACLESFRAVIDAKRLAVTTDLGAGRPHVRADPARLRQVLCNLVDNAVEYTPEGGKITLRSSGGEDGPLVVRVEDTGVGIAPEALPRIFDAFEQADRTVRGGRGGLGLGLSLSRRLVEMHGGRLTAASEGRGRGCTLTLEMPTIAAMPETAHPPAVAARTGRRGLSILLVEDHEDTLRVISRLLERLGYVVRAARSVGEALALAEGERFDLLISDLNLPDGSGLDIMRAVKERHGLRGIALSGFGREGDIQRCRDAGFETHLTKPVDFQALKLRIEAVA
jgi:PAS domain S-box-containing protein